MKKGKKLIYGYHDKKNAIPCMCTGEHKISTNGDIIITAKCDDGGLIMADINLFKIVE